MRTIKKQKTFFEFKALADKKAELYIQGEITEYPFDEYGEVSATLFKEQLDALGDVNQIDLYVNSPGGSVMQGIAIANMLKRNKAKVVAHVDALAASIASNIVASADEVHMPSNTMLMIHNAWGIFAGNSADLRKQADDLDRINDMQVETYMAKVGNKTTEENIRALMDAETWISAKEAYELGLCDVVEGANQMAACLTQDQAKQFKNVPKALIETGSKPQANTLTEEERNAILADSRASLTYLQTRNLL